MVFDPTETYLYSADMWANRVWCHKKIDDEGRLETVGYTEATQPKDHPRWVEMHPSGNYLYALMEGGNRLCEYVIDPQTKLPIYTHKTYPLIPPGEHSRDPQLFHVTNKTRYSKRRHNVPLRRMLPHTIGQISLRDLAIKLIRSHGLHRSFQGCAIGLYRAANMSESYTYFGRTLECGFTVSLER